MKSQSKMMAMVERKRGWDRNFIEIKVHGKYEDFFRDKFEQK